MFPALPWFCAARAVSAGRVAANDKVVIRHVNGFPARSAVIGRLGGVSMRKDNAAGARLGGAARLPAAIAVSRQRRKHAIPPDGDDQSRNPRLGTVRRGQGGGKAVAAMVIRPARHAMIVARHDCDDAPVRRFTRDHRQPSDRRIAGAQAEPRGGARPSAERTRHAAGRIA